MAQLKDTLVSGNLRVTDTILGDVIQVDTIKARSSSTSTTMTPGTVGQMLISNGSNVYWDTYIGSSNITTVGTISTGVWNATAISAVKGGTGQTSYAIGDLLYASAANTLGKLAANSTTTKKFLSMTSSVPSWASIASTDLPAMYIGTTRVQFSSAAQALAGITTLTTSGNVTIGGTITVGSGGLIASSAASNIYLANSSGNIFVVDGKVVRRNASITDITLGSSTYRWGGLYSTTGSFSSNVTIDGTLTVGTTSANKATTLNGTLTATGQATVGSLKLSGTNATPTLSWDATNNAWHLTGNFYADGFVSSGGLSTGGGTSGIDEAAMWESLSGNDSTKVINASHLPISVSGGTAATNQYVSAISYSGGVITVTKTSLPSAYSLPVAKYNTLGGVKPAYTSTGAAVLTTAAATNTSTPTIAAKTTTSGRYYAVEADKNGILFVNVPWISYGNGTAELLTAGTDTGNRVWQAKIIADYVKGQINAAVSSALYFRGESTTAITNGGTEKATINGDEWTATTGDLVLYNGKEFAWDGAKWIQLGDESSWAAKTVTVTGTGYLSGGGTLESNRTIDISSSKITNNTSATAVTASTNLITANTLYYHKGNSNIVTVGTISSGTWQGTAVAAAYGGTGMSGANPFSGAYRVVYTSSATAMTTLAPNTTTTKKFLSMTGTGSAGKAPTWETVSKSDVGLGNVENTALSTWTGSTSITTVGTISEGTWSGTKIAVGKGGTGKTTWTQYGVLYASATDELSQVTNNTTSTKKFLRMTGNSNAATAPAWDTVVFSDLPALYIGTTKVQSSSANQALTGITTGAFSSNVTIGGTLGVTGNTTLSGTLTVGTTSANKDTTLNGTLSVKSNVYNLIDVYRSSAGGGAFIKYYANGQTANYWLAGATQDIHFGFFYGVNGSNTLKLYIDSNANFVPATNTDSTTTQSLGTSSYRWNDLYTRRINASGLSTLAGGAKLTTTKKIWFGDTYYLELDANGLHTNAGFYSDSFVSAGGLNPSGSGSSGIDADAMWELLDATDEVIGVSHIPSITTAKISNLETWISSKGYVTSSGITSVTKGTATSGGNVSTSEGAVTIQFPTAYSLPLAASGTRGGIQIGYSTSGKNYAVQLSSEKAYVNVPWTDTTYKLTLNGTVKGATSGVDLGSFYAPTSVGTSGQFLKSGGSGAPTWYTLTQQDIHPKALTSKGTTATTTAGETYGIAGDATSGRRIFTKWFVNLDTGETELKDGMIISFRMPLAGLGTVGECITIDGNEQHFHQVVYNTNTLLTTHFAVNSVITVQYDSTIASASYGKYDSTTGKYVHNGNTTTSLKGVWRVLSLYDSGNTDVRYQQTIYNINWDVPTDGAIRRYTLCMATPDGKVTSLTLNDNAYGSTTKTMYSGYLDYRKVYYWGHTDNYNSGGTITRSNAMLTFCGSLIDFRYTFNCSTTLTGKACLYIVGTIDDNGFKLDPTTPWSCSLPSSDDGKVYIFVGTTYDTYRGTLEENNTAYWYKNGRVQVYSGYASVATSLTGTPSIAASGNNITITVGGKTSSAFTVPYATSAGSATSAAGLSAVIANNKLPTRLQQFHTTAVTAEGNGFGRLNTDSPFTSFHTSNTDCMLITTAYSADWAGQLATDYRTNNIAYRAKNNGTWTEWALMLSDKNYTTYTPILNSDSTHATNSSVIYAPTTAGTANHILISNGSGAPVWTTVATLSSASSTTANTAAYDILTLGNNASMTTTSAHSEGKIVLYSGSTNAHTIVGSSTTTAYTHTLPNDTGVLVTLSGGTAKGSGTKPVYIPATGIVTECSTYAGGTAVTLNGTSKAASTASFYAPTSVGTANQVLISGGNTAPSWTNQSNITAGALTTVSKTAWGQTYWTSGGVPTSISGDMSSVGKLTFTAKTSASSSGNILEVVTLNGVTYLHTTLPFYSDNEISAGGISSGGGTSGIDEAGMWLSLATADATKLIDTSHIQLASNAGNGLMSASDKIQFDGSIRIINLENNGSATAGTWLAKTTPTSLITSYTDGLTVRFKIPVAGASTTTLNINGLGAKTVYRFNTSKLTTHYSVNNYIVLTYNANLNSGSWICIDGYDSDSGAVVRVYRQTTGFNADYPLIVSRSATIGTAGTNSSYTNVYGVIWDVADLVPTLNPSTGELKAKKFTQNGNIVLDSSNYVNYISGGGNYLPLTGGTLTGSAGDVLGITAPNSTYSCINYRAGSASLWSVGSDNSNQFYFWTNNAVDGFVGKINNTGYMTLTGNSSGLKIQRADSPEYYYFAVTTGGFGEETNMYGGYGGSCFLQVKSVGSTSDEIAQLFLQPTGKKINICGPMYFTGVTNVNYGYTVENRTKYGLYFQTAHSGMPGILFSDDGNVSIGYDSNTGFRLYVSGSLGVSGNATIDGTISSTGDQVISSDLRLKTNIKNVILNIHDIAQAPAVTFNWKETGIASAGSIAQYWETYVPELVHTNNDKKSLAYGQLALISSIIIAREVETQEQRIERLENRIKELESEVKSLNDHINGLQ